jgi:hypothetical protein
MLLAKKQFCQVWKRADCFILYVFHTQMDIQKPLLHLLSTRGEFYYFLALITQIYFQTYSFYYFNFVVARENFSFKDDELFPLFRIATVNGDWEEGKRIIDRKEGFAKKQITILGETCLHIAVVGSHVSFVENLLKELEEDDLEQTDVMENTAFAFAASIGNVEVARIMLQKNDRLASIRGRADVTPLFLSVLKGKKAMAQYLFEQSKHILGDDELSTIFLTSISPECMVSTNNQSLLVI